MYVPITIKLTTAIFLLIIEYISALWGIIGSSLPALPEPLTDQNGLFTLALLQ